MKKIILSLIALVLVTGSFSAFANTPEAKFSVIKFGSVVKVLFKSDKASTVKIKILNADNQAVYAETIQKTSGFIRPYNISSLPEGEYTVRMTDGSGAWTEEKISTTVEYAKPTGGLFHVIKMNEEKKFMVMAAGRKGNELTIKVIDDRGKVIHEETKKSDSDLAELLNLNGLSGEFSIELSDNTGSYRSYSF